MTTTKKKTEAAKRGPGRPATGVISVSRSISLPQNYWDWIDGQITDDLPTRSHVVKSLMSRLMK